MTIEKIKEKYPDTKKHLNIISAFSRKYESNPFETCGYVCDGFTGQVEWDVTKSVEYVTKYFKAIIVSFKGDISIKHELLLPLPKVIRKKFIEEYKNKTK